MGMFDTLKVEIKIPGFSEVPDVEFQTKSLDCALENYVITNNGELYREKWDYEWTDDSSSVFNGYFNKVEGSYRREYLTDYHGDIIFYEGRSADGTWRYYSARFAEGKLTRMWYKDEQY